MNAANLIATLSSNDGFFDVFNRLLAMKIFGGSTVSSGTVVTKLSMIDDLTIGSLDSMTLKEISWNVSQS